MHGQRGSYPVIFLSFAAVKSNNIVDAKNSVISVIFDAYQQHSEQVQDDELYQALEAYTKDLNPEKRMANEVVFQALRELSRHLFQTYQKKVLILLDEYDTPMQEAYVNGYWTEFTDFIRSLFNATFKTNPYLERAIMTGITRISKESIFSDLNNPNVITTTSEEYATAFGFTEQEVFEQLDQNETAIWSLLLASCITNLETRSMFQGMFKGWFDCAQTAYRGSGAGAVLSRFCAWTSGRPEGKL